MQTKSLEELTALLPQQDFQVESFAQHLGRRGFNTHIPGWISWPLETVTFPLWSGTRLIGYQRYSWKEEKKKDNGGKYFTWLSESYRQVGLWGWEFYDRPGPLFIVEGIWDAIRAVNAGFACFAMLTATPSKELRSWFSWRTQGRRKIVIKDNDENRAGEALAKLGDIAYTVPSGKDLNDLGPERAATFLESLL